MASAAGSSPIPRGFFGKLFDFSFSSFVTPSIIQLVYGIFLVIAGIGALVVIVAGLAESPALGLLLLIISPVIFLFYAIIARIYLEIVIVLFRVAESTTQIARNTSR
ncbi:MAG TPA: DUF4282 domain-containing protein [Dehalococcoidia bacterium]|nr:DUF4282 domain-containing protein [Dehalococcoidia bacterium]